MADLVLDAGQGAELAFDDDAVVMRIFDDLAGEGDVVLETVVLPSIMTEVKPPSMQLLQVSKGGAVIRCRTMGISGFSMTAASTSFTR